MNREELAMVAFEIVAFAGDARSKLLSALNEAEKGDYDQVEELVKEAEEALLKAHRAQTDLLHAEAQGQENEIGLLMIHAQDHLMNAMLLKDMMKHMITLYKRTK
ncbi:PTS lactose/cellobiose transporter subunit IIA [Risungbinella massiliensis]|uniref:PTS lactose/cellobiose transporter subunit IIA n=1 Tax=Risungbinella massiliensis TaxID=1329796 RepID=UPI0005CC0E26|nr:PTS lactose/cellobiose transporter subunit IIA [Risungbinella massiliensis]